MFEPKYTITDHLLANIKHINTLVIKLNNKHFSHVVFARLERSAREVSTYASTSIEGNPLPLTEVKRILKSRPSIVRDSEREILNYNQALLDLDKGIKGGEVSLSLKLVLNIQKQVTSGLLPAHECGKIRQKPVMVNDPRNGRVIYLPPDFKDVQKLTGELVNFTNDNRSKVDPLLLAGVFHKQMVVIHPFVDGNGRTARLATKVLLAAMGLNTFNLFSFENYYNKNVTRYFQTVGEFGNYYELVKKIDFTPWLEYFTGGIIDELLRVQKIFSELPIDPALKLQPYHLKMLEFIRKNGAVADRDYAKLVDRAKATRTLDFQRLMGLGLIKREGKGRATYYTLTV